MEEALNHIRQIAKETSDEIAYGGVRQPAVLRTFSQRLSKGFNDAVSGFTDDGWSLLGSDGVEDVTIMINSSPNKLFGSHANSSIFSPIGGGILCAKILGCITSQQSFNREWRQSTNSLLSLRFRIHIDLYLGNDCCLFITLIDKILDKFMQSPSNEISVVSNGVVKISEPNTEPLGTK
ncbi:uncharacterized protein A4U43_C05F35740 [Asparagus officinalis]|uniref:START domain-containing protein n=1 Tax=Asparagus officinalis TaxID=4686 RepID=A0A5P1F2H6_ASPOF|nr:uncharacterized protein A4U43_C05F35740 [Asparagus officinalis]